MYTRKFQFITFGVVICPCDPFRHSVSVFLWPFHYGLNQSYAKHYHKTSTDNQEWKESVLVAKRPELITTMIVVGIVHPIRSYLMQKSRHIHLQ